MAKEKTFREQAEECAHLRELHGRMPDGYDDRVTQWIAVREGWKEKYGAKIWDFASEILRTKYNGGELPAPLEDDGGGEGAEDTVSVAEATAWSEVNVKKITVTGRLPSDFSRACHGLTPSLRFAQDALGGELLTKRGEEPWRIPDKTADAAHRSLFKESVGVTAQKKGKTVREPWNISAKEWSDLRAGEAGLNRQNDFADYVSACEVSDDPDAPSVSDLFIEGFGCDDTVLNREAAWLLMAAMVRRGCLMDGDRGTWFDYCVVLAGPQGTAKTKGLPLLFPEHLRATRTTSNALLMARSDSEFVRSITGMVLAVADEMAGRTKADREALKARITRHTDKVRRLYHDQTEHRVRTAVVCATANPDDEGFIPDDSTGLRRWIPVMVPAPADDDRFTPLQRTEAFFDEYRDHLWALAYKCAKKNPALILSDEAFAEAEVLRRDHEKKPDLLFVDWLKDVARTTSSEGVTMDELLGTAAEPRTRLAPPGNIARTAALKQAGWTRVRRRINGSPQRVWVPPMMTE